MVASRVAKGVAMDALDHSAMPSEPVASLMPRRAIRGLIPRVRHSWRRTLARLGLVPAAKRASRTGRDGCGPTVGSVARSMHQARGTDRSNRSCPNGPVQLGCRRRRSPFRSRGLLLHVVQGAPVAAQGHQNLVEGVAVAHGLGLLGAAGRQAWDALDQVLPLSDGFGDLTIEIGELFSVL